MITLEATDKGTLSFVNNVWIIRDNAGKLVLSSYTESVALAAWQQYKQGIVKIKI